MRYIQLENTERDRSTGSSSEGDEGGLETRGKEESGSMMEREMRVEGEESLLRVKPCK